MSRRRRLADGEGRLSALVLQLITGIPKFRVAGAERRAFSVWASAFAAQRRLGIAARRISNTNSVFFSVLPAAASCLIFWGMLRSSTGSARMSSGEFVAFNSAFVQLLGATIAFTRSALALLDCVPEWERLLPLLRAVPETDATKASPGQLAGGH